MEEYTRSKIANFIGGNLQEDQLQAEIQADPGIISQTLLHISTDGDVVSLAFSGELLEGEVTQMDYLISIHIPAPKKLGANLYMQAGTDIVKYTDSTGIDRVFLGLSTNEIHITKETQGQYHTIQDALAAANGRANMIFRVHEGVYAEANPLVIPNGCTLHAVGTAVNTFIACLDPTKDAIALGTNCTLQGFTVTGTNGRGVYLDGTLSGGMGQFSVISQCFFRNCNIALESDGKNGGGAIDTLFLREVIITPTNRSLQKAIYVHAGGLVISSSVMIAGIPAPYNFTIGTAIHCAGQGSKVAMAVTSTWYCGTGLYLDDNAITEMALFTCKNNQNGIVVGPNGTLSRFSVTSLDCKGSFVYDIDVQATDADFELHSGFTDCSKIHNPNNVKMNARFHSSAYGKFFHTLMGDVNIGTSTYPSKLSIGQGRYDNTTVHVFKNDSAETAGTWQDVTTVASIYPSVSFEPFASTASGACLYLGRKLENVIGYKIETITPVGGVAKGNVVHEYWNGTIWAPLNVMQTFSDPPYYSVNGSFLSAEGKYQIRFGATSASDFAEKTLNGVTARWSRLRLVNSLATMPETRYVKFHCHECEINKDGFIEHYGDSRPTSTLPLATVAGYYAMAQTVFASQGLSARGLVFPHGVVTSVGYCCTFPRSVDCSFPLKVRIWVAAQDQGIGSVTWTLKWTATNQMPLLVKANAVAVNANEQSIETTVTSSAQTSFVVNMDVSQMFSNPADPAQETLFWLSISRSDADSYQGSVTILQLRAEHVQWCAGGAHILAF